MRNPWICANTPPMSFLNHLKTHARSLQDERGQTRASLDHNLQVTEKACQLIDWYLRDLATQLNVIEPLCGPVSVDGKRHWPPMKRTDFRADARKTMLHNREVFERLGMGWQLLPQQGQPVTVHSIANFPPDLAKIESRLAAGKIAHEKVAVRHPENGQLKEFRFECVTMARAGVLMMPRHVQGQIEFHLSCVDGFQNRASTLSATEVDASLMDELAKAIVGHDSHFLTR
jgi:hypothetical protein